MNQPRTHASLLTRVVQAEERAKAAAYQSPDAPRQEPSFVERYRGTEWETPSSVVVVDSAPARGHTFVWVTLSAMIATTALIIGGSIL